MRIDNIASALWWDNEGVTAIENDGCEIEHTQPRKGREMMPEHFQYHTKTFNLSMIRETGLTCIRLGNSV